MLNKIRFALFKRKVNKKFNKFDLLALADRAKNEKDAWEIMNYASQLFHWQDDNTFNVLYGAVAMDITLRFKRKTIKKEMEK